MPSLLKQFYEQKLKSITTGLDNNIELPDLHICSSDPDMKQIVSIAFLLFLDFSYRACYNITTPAYFNPLKRAYITKVFGDLHQK